MMKSFDVLIVGAGTGGIMTAAQLRKKAPELTIGIIDPADTHWYQPAWTLVGAGAYSYQKTARAMSSVIPAGTEWLKDKVTSLDPDNNQLSTENSGVISYNELILSPGLVYNLDGIDGLREAMDTDYVCSNYLDPGKTYRILQNFKGGNAVFTQPTTPIKCGGAPMKIMFLAEDYLRKHGLRDKSNVIFATPGSVIFGVKEFAKTLNKIILKRNIIFKTFYAPYKIDSKNKTITFKYVEPEGNDCVINQGVDIGEQLQGQTDITMPYDILHLAPPQQAPDFIRNSSVAIQEGPGTGWMDVNKDTLAHNRYDNIHGIGDAAFLPTAKTGAAIRKQAPVVVDRIIAKTKGRTSNATYSGYSSCPIVTRYGRMLLAEFKYGNVRDSDPLLTKFVNTTKESWLMWLLKLYGLPYLYWNQMMKGKM